MQSCVQKEPSLHASTLQMSIIIPRFILFFMFLKYDLNNIQNASNGHAVTSLSNIIIIFDPGT